MVGESAKKGIPSWALYRKTALVKAMQMGEEFEVETLEGTMRGAAGDYLCEGIAGERWPIKQEIFQATYEFVKHV